MPSSPIEPPFDSHDPVEREYMQAIDRARTSDEAYELSIGLHQYRESYKDTSSGS
jgi:hypothetical protein